MEPIRKKPKVVAVGALGLFALGVVMSCVRARIAVGWLRETVMFAGVLCIVGCVTAINALCEKRKPGVRRRRRLSMFLLLTLIIWSLELLVRYVFFPLLR